MAVCIGNNLQSNISTGAIGDINVTHNSFLNSIVPDYANWEVSINRITTNGGTWTVNRDGFVTCFGASSVANNARFRMRINGSSVSTIPLSGPNLTAGGISPVKTGDVVDITIIDTGNNLVATATNIQCYYTPPRIDNTPNPNAPNTWPTTGAEINFGDGTFGVRRVGNLPTTAANMRNNFSIIAVPNARILNFGGWVQRGGAGAIERHALGHMIPNGDTISSWAFSSNVFTNDTNILIQTVAAYARTSGTNTAYDVWVRYTK